jgi:hypothetical protein
MTAKGKNMMPGISDHSKSLTLQAQKGQILQDSLAK